MIDALAYACLAGIAIPLGGLAAYALGQGTRAVGPWAHGIVAFGGGALISAVALVLVPGGIGFLGPAAAILAFGSGGLAFAGLDAWLARRKGRHGQLVAMLADFLPESAALGALLASGEAGGPLLAALIALQNLPESYNAFGEARTTGLRPRRLLAIFAAIALLGPLAAALGHLFLAGHEASLGLVMLFAAGGILYLVFEDVAPGAPAKGSVLPPLGAVAGFLLGLAGHLLQNGIR